MADREADDVGLQLVHRAKGAVAPEQGDRGVTDQRSLAARLADLRGEVRRAVLKARLHLDMREMFGAEGRAVALQGGAEQDAGQLAYIARPAVTHQQRQRVVA